VNFGDFKATVLRAEAFGRGGDWLQAKQTYLDLVSQRLTDLQYRPASLTEADLRVVERLADLAVLFGELQAADDLLASIEAAYRPRGTSWLADQATIKRLHLALSSGRLYDAVDLLRSLSATLGPIDEIDVSEQGLARLEAASPWPVETLPVLFAQLYLELGRLLAGLGRHRDALTLLSRGRLHSDDGAAPPQARESAIPLRLSMAATRLQQGDLHAGMEELADLPALDERRHPGWAVRRRELLARVHLLRGEWPQAQADLEQIMEMCRARGLSRSWTWAAANLAGVRLLLNRIADAQELLAAASQLAATIGDHALTWWIERRLALVSERGGLLLGKDPALAVSDMQEAVERDGMGGAEAAQGTDCPAPPELEPAPRPGDGLTYFELRALELQTWLAHRDLGRAGECFDDLHREFGPWDSHLIQVRLGVLGSMMDYYRGVAAATAGRGAEQYWHKAEMGFLEARAELQQLGLRPELYEVQRRLGWCWDGLGRPAPQRDALTAENERLLDAMAQPLAAGERAAYLVNKWTADERALAMRIDELVKIRQAAKNAGVFGRTKRRIQAWRQLGALLDRIYRLKDELVQAAVEPSARPASQGEVDNRFYRWALNLMLWPRRRATLAFLVLPNQTLVVRMGWMSLDFEVAAVTRLEIRQLVGEWHRQVAGLAGQESLDEAGARRVAGAIGERLGITGQLASLPAAVRELTVVPDDCLHGFPFAALPLEGGYLVERYAVSLAYHCTSRRPPRPASRGVHRRREALLAGVDESPGDLPALPDGARQLRWVERVLVRRGLAVTSLRNGQVRKEELLARLPQVAMWHMSCHGIFHPDHPEATGLMLLPQGNQEQLLSLRELSALRLFHLRQVVLASCWGADNYLLPGRWVISLPEVLWRAGAASVLACLWEVEDRAVGRLSRDFYVALGRLPRVRALRRAQLRMLHRRETSHPIFWAGYQLYGDAGRLRW
jgi:tetratricopeptide (TPR) repeat protein